MSLLWVSGMPGGKRGVNIHQSAHSVAPLGKWYFRWGGGAGGVGVSLVSIAKQS